MTDMAFHSIIGRSDIIIPYIIQSVMPTLNNIGMNNDTSLIRLVLYPRIS